MKTVKPEPIDLNKFKRVFLVNTTPTLFEETIFHGLSLFELLFKDRNGWFDPGEKQRTQWLNQLLQIEGKYLGISKKVMDKVIRPLALARLHPYNSQSEDMLSWACEAITRKVDVNVEFINQLPNGITTIVWFTKFNKDNFSQLKSVGDVYKKLMLKNAYLGKFFIDTYKLYYGGSKEDLSFYWGMIKPYLESCLAKASFFGLEQVQLSGKAVDGGMDTFICRLMDYYGGKEYEHEFYDTGKRIELVKCVESGKSKVTGVLCYDQSILNSPIIITENFINFIDNKIEGLYIRELKTKLKQLCEERKKISGQAKQNKKDISEVKAKIAEIENAVNPVVNCGRE